jgi:hypothetical protein
LVDEFSDGRIQFAFVKVKDPNTSLPKNVLIAWVSIRIHYRGYGTDIISSVAREYQSGQRATLEVILQLSLSFCT